MVSGRARERNHGDAPEAIRDGRFAGGYVDAVAAEMAERERLKAIAHRRLLQAVVERLIRAGVLEEGSVTDGHGSVRTPTGERVNLEEVARGKLRGR